MMLNLSKLYVASFYNVKLFYFFLAGLISSEPPEWIAHGRSFLMRDMSDLLTSLIWFEQNERFTNIPHQKEEMSKNERFAHFFEYFF